MRTDLALIIGGLLIGLTGIIMYYLGKTKSRRLMKYIPAISSAVCLCFFYLKFLFISKGFEGIIDVLVIMFLAFMFAVSILIAVIQDIVKSKKKALEP